LIGTRVAGIALAKKETRDHVLHLIFREPERIA